jgi:hypothetical protein
MEPPNAFIGATTLPSPEQIRSALGPSATAWEILLKWLIDQGVTGQEWQSISPKYGWGLRIKQKKRTIVYLGPCKDCFRVSFVLGDRAVKAAKASGIPDSHLQALAEARRYAEGTGLQLIVREESELPPIRTLTEIKLAN